MRKAPLGALVGLALGLAALAADQPAPVVTSLTLFAGNAAGLWRSTDWGGTWKPVNRSPLDELGAARSLLATGARVYLGGAGGFYSSDDFGETWKRLGTTTELRAVLSSRYPDADPTLFAATSAGLLKSTDGGNKFAPTAIGGEVDRLEWPGPALVAAGPSGLFISEDGAQTVRTPLEGLPPGPVRSLALSSFFAADPVMFVGVGHRGLYRSGDGGKRFLPAGLAGQTVNDLVWLGPILYAATGDGLFRSESAGKHWEKIGEGLAGRQVRRLLFPLAPDSGAEVFVATDQGVYRSADGGVRFERLGMRDQGVDWLATFPPPPPRRKKK